MVESRNWSPPKKVILIGGAGFVGTYVCRQLAENGQSPIVVDLKPFSPEFSFALGEYKDKVKFVEGDVCSPEDIAAAFAANPADAIVHLAGYVGHEKSLANPPRAYAVNVGGTVNVLEAARNANIKKVVTISTSSVYHKKAYEPIDEKHPITSVTVGNPNAHYGSSKVGAEQAALAYYTYHDLDVLVARITSVYGFAMSSPMHVAPLVEGAVRGEPVVIETGGAVKRAYTHVEDIAAGIVKMVNTDSRNLEQRVYNITNGQLVSGVEIADVVRQIFPEADLHVGKELTELEQTLVQYRANISPEAAHQAFGFKARYSIKDGVRRYVELLNQYIASQH